MNVIKRIGMQLIDFGQCSSGEKDNIAKTMKEYKGPASNYHSRRPIFCVIVSDDSLTVFVFRSDENLFVFHR